MADLRQQLFDAVMADDAEGVRRCLAEGADPREESQPGAGDSAVYAASGHGRLEVLAILAEAWKRRDPEGFAADTILFHCLFGGQVEAGQYLADLGVALPFPMAVALGRLDAARAFLLDGELVEDGRTLTADERMRGYNCAFFYACLCGCVEGLAFAVDGIEGIDMQPPAEDFGGVSATAMHWAASHGRAEAIEWLLERGADPTIRDGAWKATPAGWASHGEHAAALAVFRKYADRLCEADREWLL